MGSFDLQFNPITAGADFGAAKVVLPGGNVFLVRGNGTTITNYASDPPGLRERLLPSVVKALSLCTASQGDTIYVLPGHTESLATAGSWTLKAGVKIIGVGGGSERPTFTWTAAASTVLVSVANVTIANCVLNFEPGTGTVNVAAPITVSAAGFRLLGNTIRFATDSNNKTTIGITTTAAATDMEISYNHCYGATTGEVTTFLDVIGCDRLRMVKNHFGGATSSTTVGIVRFATTASLHVWLEQNFYVNRKASSTHAVTGLAGVTGASLNELFLVLNDGTTTTWGTSTGSMAFFNPRISNQEGEVGMLSTTVST